MHATPDQESAGSCHTALASVPAGYRPRDIYHPTLRGLNSQTMMLSCHMLLVDRQALSEHTTTSSSTKSLGQALRVSLVKPGAYLSESYFRAASPPPFRHGQVGHAPASWAGHCLFSIAWSNHTDLLKPMLIDTRDSSLLQMNIGLFSARMSVSRVSCPVDTCYRSWIVV